ncbi:hypothetical protein HPB51_010984 [Rhipicephalus microplus]|uniref:Uncharacterized protein n=1 Tax=Rhipicephalus microplus TaxID=6941 RepID=A0A9J6D9L8_RHIMP|nr:hypothetical protein HPB51_010984 [Rhipicephalus microplus]
MTTLRPAKRLKLIDTKERPEPPVIPKKTPAQVITAPQAQQAGSQADVQTPVSMRCDGKMEKEGSHAEPSQATAAELEMAADSGEGGKHGENGARSASGDDEAVDDAASAAKTWSLQRYMVAWSRECQATGKMTASRRQAVRKQCASSQAVRQLASSAPAQPQGQMCAVNQLRHARNVVGQEGDDGQFSALKESCMHGVV